MFSYGLTILNNIIYNSVQIVRLVYENSRTVSHHVTMIISLIQRFYLMEVAIYLTGSRGVWNLQTAPLNARGTQADVHAFTTYIQSKLIFDSPFLLRRSEKFKLSLIGAHFHWIRSLLSSAIAYLKLYLFVAYIVTASISHISISRF